MKTFGRNRNVRPPEKSHSLWQPVAILAVLSCPSAITLCAQTSQPSIPAQIQQLTAAMERTQAQLEQSQQQLDEMRAQITALQQQMAQREGTSVSATASVDSATPVAAQPQSQSSEVDSIRERQAMLEAQVATHDQTKVESESKYPVKITGLLLFNSFVNTSGVDMPATPTIAVPGSGSTGASVRQTVLGVDARGPHLFGAHSYADLRVDF